MIPARAILALAPVLTLGAAACGGPPGEPGCFEWKVVASPAQADLDGAQAALEAAGQTCTRDGEAGAEHLTCSAYGDEQGCEDDLPALTEALAAEGIAAEVGCVCSAQG